MTADTLTDFADGLTDATAALQAYLDAGGYRPLPKGRFRLSDTLRIRRHVKMVGEGHPADGAGLLADQPLVIADSTPLGGTVLLPVAGLPAIDVTTQDAVQLTDLMICYAPYMPQPGSGADGIRIQPPDVQHTNCGTTIRDVCIYGADRGLVVTNGTGTRVDGCWFLMSARYGAMFTSFGGVQNYVNGGDWFFTHNYLNSGSGWEGYAAGVFVQGTAGLIAGNKFQPAAGSQHPSAGVFVCPDASVSGRVIEPLRIQNNTIEGCTNGIRYYSPGDGSATLGLITGNQVWCDTPILIEASPARRNDGRRQGVWVDGLNISGNVLQMDDGGAGISIDGAQNVLIADNIFTVFGGSGKGIRTGARIYNFKIRADTNVFAPGVTP